jgi:hypothetical protein
MAKHKVFCLADDMVFHCSTWNTRITLFEIDTTVDWFLTVAVGWYMAHWNEICIGLYDFWFKVPHFLNDT